MTVTCPMTFSLTYCSDIFVSVISFRFESIKIWTNIANLPLYCPLPFNGFSCLLARPTVFLFCALKRLNLAFRLMGVTWRAFHIYRRLSDLSGTVSHVCKHDDTCTVALWTRAAKHYITLRRTFSTPTSIPAKCMNHSVWNRFRIELTFNAKSRLRIYGPILKQRLSQSKINVKSSLCSMN
jgi:hypothetical protein